MGDSAEDFPSKHTFVEVTDMNIMCLICYKLFRYEDLFFLGDIDSGLRICTSDLFCSGCILKLWVIFHHCVGIVGFCYRKFEFSFW